jgi:signal recognition particle subunit SRP54
MFETLTRGFRAAKNRLTGKAELTEAVIDEALRDIRLSLLEADVDYQVTRSFLAQVREKAVGEVVALSAEAKGKKVRVSPADHFVAICQRELVAMMGPVETRIDRAKKGVPTGIMMAGLQGSGKTTTVGKLARFLMKKGHHPLLVAADVYRPAAVDQIQVIGARLKIPVWAEPGSKDAVGICQRAMVEARRTHRDIVIFDTAGRLAIDEPLMVELEQIKQQVRPKNIFLVCDAMMGQDAVNTAREFHRRLDVTGVILTKLDGDARGGAALSVKNVTGKPIKFIGVGEKLDKLEEFHPDRMASRILGMGDVVTLVEKAQEQFDKDEAEKMQKKMAKGSFGFDDFLKQMQSVKKMGGIKDMLKLLPGVGSQIPDVDLDGGELEQMEAIVYSMTLPERRDPDLIDGSRRRRIAAGAGVQPNDVSTLVKTFKRSRDMMKAISGGSFGGLKSLLSGGFNMEAMNNAMTHGRKIKQRSKRKKVIKRHGKIKKKK